jgi:hypothetical protein
VETEPLRLWSVHPKYLDTAGLVALWREALLAQKVLKGETRGYKNHPQLVRFRNHPEPLKAIADYLTEVWKESQRRGFDFDKKKIGPRKGIQKITVTRGQLVYEIDLLCHKTSKRSPDRCRELLSTSKVEPHPIFKVVAGEVEKWEKVKKVPPDR